jgi:hypothetical protein
MIFMFFVLVFLSFYGGILLYEYNLNILILEILCVIGGFIGMIYIFYKYYVRVLNGVL